jgi:hypothetical protein
MSLLPAAQWLEATAAGVMVRESLYGFPILVAIHLLGLTISVGIVIWWDLRLLGVSMPGCRVSEVYRRLMPWAFAGYAAMFVSGGLLLAGFATAAHGNIYFRLKVAALVLAGVNAIVYHRVAERTMTEWDDDRTPPPIARAAGLISISVWIVVVLAGRMMSYTMF